MEKINITKEESFEDAISILKAAGIERKLDNGYTCTEYHGFGFYLYIRSSKKYINIKPQIIQIQFEHATMYDDFDLKKNFIEGPWQILLNEIANHPVKAVAKQDEYFKNIETAKRIDDLISEILYTNNQLFKFAIPNTDIELLTHEFGGHTYVVQSYSTGVLYRSIYGEIETFDDSFDWESILANYLDELKQDKYNIKYQGQIESVNKYLLELRNNNGEKKES